jgi:hypothetical protein
MAFRQAREARLHRSHVRPDMSPLFSLFPVFNQAVSGAIAEDLNGQADTLIGIMAASEAINFQEDWKVITI